MAKKRDKNLRETSHKKRGLQITTNLPRLLLKNLVQVPLSPIEDNRRRYFPHNQPRGYYVRVDSGYRHVPLSRSRPPTATHRLSVRPKLPIQAVVCVRRRIRREVLLAMGRGGGNHKRKYHRNQQSNVRCKK